MGWNLSIVHAHGPAATLDGFALANGYRPDTSPSPPTFGELVQGPDDGDWARPAMAAAEVGTGLLLAAQLIVTHGWAASLSERKGGATWATWQSTTTSYGFARYVDGQLVRVVTRKEHEFTYQEGAALPEEAPLRWNDPAAEPDDEADLFALVEHVTGLPDAAHWLAGPALLYRPTPITELDLPPKKRRIFGR